MKFNKKAESYASSDAVINLLNSFDPEVSLSDSTPPTCQNILNFGCISRAGTSDEGSPKENQDSMAILAEQGCVIPSSNLQLFGIMDGHGRRGSFVSREASEFATTELQAALMSAKDAAEADVRHIFRKNFLLLQNKFESMEDPSLSFSGSTMS